jgi:flagellar assembly protein FliH
MRLVPLVHALKRETRSAAGSKGIPPKQAGQHDGQRQGEKSRRTSACPLPDIEELTQHATSPERTAARQQAEAILQQAHAEADQIRQQAQQEGYQAGYQEGWQHAQTQLEEQLQQHLTQLRDEVQRFLQQLQAQFEEYLRLLEPQMLALTLQIARKVIRDELQQHPEHVLTLIRETLRRVQGFGGVRIRVNPFDLELVRQKRASLLTVIDSLEGLEIVEDRRVEPGGCLIETTQGIYDARIQTQLDEIARELCVSPPSTLAPFAPHLTSPMDRGGTHTPSPSTGRAGVGAEDTQNQSCDEPPPPQEAA